MDDDKSITGYEKALIEGDAYRLIEANAAYREACLEVERRLIEDWAATDEGETSKREGIWQRLKVFRLVLSEIDHYYGSYVASKQDIVEDGRDIR